MLEENKYKGEERSVHKSIVLAPDVDCILFLTCPQSAIQKLIKSFIHNLLPRNQLSCLFIKSTIQKSIEPFVHNLLLRN